MFDSVDALMRSAVADGAFPGCALAIGLRERSLLTACYGRLGSPDSPAVTPETRYDLASLTKIVAPTMLALRALEDGKLALADTLSQFFDAPADKRDITIFNLMTHTSGMEPSFLLEENALDPRDALRAILARKLLYPVGKRAEYSCMGYITLGKILEKCYGLPLDEAAKRYVFAPLGMTATGYLPSGDNIAPTEIDAATGEPWQGIVHDENARFQNGVSANAGVFSNIMDLSRFAGMLACGGRCDGTTFLARDTLRLAASDHTPGMPLARGLGFELAARGVTFFGDLWPREGFGHTGFTGTSMAIDPRSGLYAVLLSNRVYPTRENMKLTRVRKLLHNLIYATYQRECCDEKESNV